MEMEKLIVQKLWGIIQTRDTEKLDKLGHFFWFEEDNLSLLSEFSNKEKNELLSHDYEYDWSILTKELGTVGNWRFPKELEYPVLDFDMHRFWADTHFPNYPWF